VVSVADDDRASDDQIRWSLRGSNGFAALRK
jgi:hypothetical protein